MVGSRPPLMVTGALQSSFGGEMSQDSYTRAARLVYIARYTIDGPKLALIQAHRRAASAVSVHPDDDDAAVREALRSTIDELGAWRSRGLFGGPRLAPVEATDEQRKVLDQIKALDYRVAVAALLYLLEDVAVEDLAVVLGSEKSSHYQESVREAVVSLCGGRTTGEVRELLLGRELDPMIVPVSARATLKRRRRRIRAGSVATAVIVAMAAAGVWWFGIRVAPLGSYAGDPQIQTQSLIYESSYGLNAWPARGELLDDAALLRRAADAWRARGLPSGKRPRVLFAGRVHDVEVVVLTNDDPNGSDFEAAVYAEGLRDKELNTPTPGDTRLLVNPYPDDPAGPGAIRLMDSPAFQADPILLPPTASDVETGPLDTPSAGWHPAHPDARGVIEVPEPPRTPQQQQDFAQGWSPSGGIRFKESNKNVVMASPVTVPEAFADAAPLLPVIASDYLGHQALSGADWCAARKQAESSEHFFDVGFSLESFSDKAGGPMPDGGGTGYLISRQGTGPGHGPFTGLAVLTQSGPSCDSAVFEPDKDLTASVVDGPAPSDRSFVSAVTAAMVWTSPAQRTYLVVAAAAGVAKLRVSGPVTASTDGRWLVVPLPYVNTNGAPSEAPLVEAYDAAGHRCGDPDPAEKNGQYCEPS